MEYAEARIAGQWCTSLNFITEFGIQAVILQRNFNNLPQEVTRLLGVILSY
jgi:hypothetical protein